MNEQLRREQLARAAYEAFNARDLERLVPLLAVDVIWPNAIDGGELRGRYSVLIYGERLFSLVPSSRLDPEGVVETDEPTSLDMRVRQTIDLGAGPVSGPALHRFHFERDGGLISRLQVLEGR